jgi:hypothetical protein
MKKEFISYEQALALKELGFDEPCLGRYDSLKVLITISRPKSNSYHKGSVPSFLATPLYQQAFRWFREKYSLVCIITFDDDVKGKWFGNLYGHYETHGKYDFGYTELFKTYEEAELECLKKLIEIVNG